VQVLIAALVMSTGCPMMPGLLPAASDYVLRSRANVVTWDDGGEVSRFVYLHPSEVFPAAVVRRAGAVRELPRQPRPEIGDFVVDESGASNETLREVADDEYDGFLVVHNGAIVYEQYPRMRPDDRHLNFSVTKSFVGTLIGILEDRGVLDLAAPVETYVPDLAGTAWAGTKLGDVADMVSGIEGVEDSTAAYLDPHHKHFQMEAALGWQPTSEDMPAEVRSGDAYGFLRTLARIRPPGTKQAYTSINTLVLTEVIERVTGQRLADAIGDEIWSRIGAEGDAPLLENGRGIPIPHGGMAMRLRDLARFGMQFVDTASGGPSSCAPSTRPGPIIRATSSTT